jgi:hypothetical protein
MSTNDPQVTLAWTAVIAPGPHVHYGPVVGSILAGSAIYQIEGQPESVLRAGDVFFEPEGERIARFDATTVPVSPGAGEAAGGNYADDSPTGFPAKTPGRCRGSPATARGALCAGEG